MVVVVGARGDPPEGEVGGVALCPYDYYGW